MCIYLHNNNVVCKFFLIKSICSAFVKMMIAILLTLKDTYQCSNPNCSQTIHMPCHNLNPISFPYIECPSCILKYSDPTYQVLEELQSANPLSTSKHDFDITIMDFQFLQNSRDAKFFPRIKMYQVPE